MRPQLRTHRGSHTPSRTIAVPAAIVGSIALSLTTAPAHAEPQSFDPRSLRATPVTAENPRGIVVQTSATHAMSPRATAASTPSTYTVRRGDTVSAIAARFGLRTADVLAVNGLSWKSIIHPGDVLTLTGGTSSAKKSSASATAAEPATKSAATRYVVVAGDTLSAIASRHGVSTKSLMQANGLGWSSIIYPGQKIAVPGASGAVASNTSSSGSTPAKAKTSGTYTIVAGDTMSAIAQRHSVTLGALLSSNDLSASSIIYPGQKITIPAKSGAAAAAPASHSAPAASASGLDAEQKKNARLIIEVGRELGVSDRGIAIALGTAMQESWIRNLDWGDRDSLGLFQQRPSTGWGSADQVRDRTRSIRAFYGGPSDPNGSMTRGLLDIPGWEKMSFADAAQAVQISAYPQRYAQWEKPAYEWLAALG